jgi:hypothetical protein
MTRDVFAEAGDPERFPWPLDFVIRQSVEAGFTPAETFAILRDTPGHFRVAAGMERLYGERIRAIIRQTAEADASADAVPAGRRSLSRADVLQARRSWQHGDGRHPWVIAGVSKATYLRARDRYGLKPWPPLYQGKMTP